jgi:serine/threonine protein kinase
VAGALQYAHERKVIHRDVKPENMLLGEKNEILLSDFGIAVVSQNSRSGQDVNGTVAYMAPEQLQGKPQPASDQYALAIVAYELLAGEVPFKGSFAEVGSQHLFATLPPLREKVSTISPDVESVLQTALSKDPQRRFAAIQAFANALEQAALSTDVMTELGSAHPAVPTALNPSNQYQALVPPPPPGVTPVLMPPPPPQMVPGSGNYAGQPSGQYPPVGRSGNMPPTPTPPAPPNSAVGGTGPQQQLPQHPSGNYGPVPQGQGQMTPAPSLQPSGPQAPIHLLGQPQTTPRRGDEGTTQNIPSSSPALAQTGQPGQFVSPAQKNEKKKKGNGLILALVVLVVLLLLVTTSSVVYAFVWQGKLPWVAAKPTVTATQLSQAATATPNQAATVDAQASATADAQASATADAQATATVEISPTATSSDSTPTVDATPTNSTSNMQYNEDIKNFVFSCASTCESHVKVVLKSITIDVNADSMIWNFQVTNNGSQSCGTYGDVSLKDPNGTTLQDQGGTFSDQTTLSAGQDLPLTLTFSQVPFKNTLYLMEASVTCGYNTDSFRVEQFVFKTGK